MALRLYKPTTRQYTMMGLIGGIALTFSCIVAAPLANDTTRNMLAFMVNCTVFFTILIALYNYKLSIDESEAKHANA